jgi:hypothetical protein
MARLKCSAERQGGKGGGEKGLLQHRGHPQHGTAEGHAAAASIVSVIQIVRVCPIDPLGAPASPEQSHHPSWCSDMPYSENSRWELG